MAKPTGIILYEGPSAINGQQIAVIVSGTKRPSKNGKTGKMLQVYIICADVHPKEAWDNGTDDTICGNCPLRGIVITLANGTRKNKGRGCYVLSRGPSVVYKCYKRGGYEHYNPKKHDRYLQNRPIRFGAYGDPVAAPYRIWANLSRLASRTTGYSHQWRHSRFWRFKRLLMASCETNADAMTARGRGWRTFRSGLDAPQSGEFECPASKEQGKRLTCEQCGACNGAQANANRASVYIRGHGGVAVASNYAKALRSLHRP